VIGMARSMTGASQIWYPDRTSASGTFATRRTASADEIHATWSGWRRRPRTLTQRAARASHAASRAPALEELTGHVPTPEESLARERGLTPLSVTSQFARGQMTRVIYTLPLLTCERSHII